MAQRSESATPPAVIDVVVTDAEGNAVRDLGPSDFSIVTGKQTRSVSALAAVDTVSGTARGAAPLPLPMKLDPGELRRTFAVVVDDAGISAGDASALRTALTQFVGTQIGPRDSVALFRTTSGSSEFEQLTSDKRLLRSAIGRISFNPAAAQPSAPPWPQVLDYALGGLRAIEGRKAVVLFCRSVPSTCGFATTLAMANRAWSSIYLLGDGKTLGCLEELAVGSGGLKLDGGFAQALARTASDQAGYYLLGFDPGDGREEQVSIHVSRPGLNVRARRHLPAVRVPSRIAEDIPPVLELRRTMASPLKAGTMRLRGAAGFRRAGVTNTVEVALLVEGSDISFTRRLNGNCQASLDVAVEIVSAGGAPAQDRANTVEINCTDEERKGILEMGLSLPIRIPVSKPGVYQVYAGVRDGTSSNTGLCRTLVEVPDFAKKNLLLSMIRLVPGVHADAPEDQLEAYSVQRAFRPGEEMAYDYDIYNAQPDDHGTAQLEVSSTIYSGGRAVYSGTPNEVTSPDAAHKPSLSVRGKLRLGDQTPPGEFVLQVSVTDKVNARTASQWIDFSLR